jgi:hypothetical protein
VDAVKAANAITSLRDRHSEHRTSVRTDTYAPFAGPAEKSLTSYESVDFAV